jgi:GAF domain-containing protein
MSEDRLRAAVAAAVMGSESAFADLLRSVAEVARAIFGARAASIFLLDEATDELVFEAVAGEGSERLLGRRFPSSTGLAGWVLVTRQPFVIEDVSEDPALGVLEVLDRPQRSRFSLQEMDLLALFANQAAIALDLLRSARRAKEVLEGGENELALVARVASALETLDPNAHKSGTDLLRALAEVLARR